MPDRRGFLRGLVTSVTTGGLLLASRDTLAVGTPVDVTVPQPEYRVRWWDGALTGQEVYVRQGGDFVPVGLIDSINVSLDRLDVTRLGDDEPSYVPAGLDVDIHVKGNRHYAAAADALTGVSLACPYCQKGYVGREDRCVSCGAPRRRRHGN